MSPWNTGNRLRGGIAALVLIPAGIGGFASYLLWEASAATAQLGRDSLPEMQLAMAFEREILTAHAHFASQMAAPKASELEAGWEHFGQARELMKKLRRQATGSAHLAAFRAPTEQMANDLDAGEALLTGILDAVKNDQTEDPLFASLVQTWTPVDSRLVEMAAELSVLSGRAGEDLSRQYAARLDLLAWVVACGCLFAVVAGSLAGWLLARRAIRGLARAGRDLNAAAGELASLSKGIDVVTSGIAADAFDQTEGLREVTSSCAGMESLARTSAGKAQLLAATMVETRRVSETGMEALVRMTGAMDEVTAANGKVLSIVNVIDELAMQTNLLALRAAAEAERSAETARAFSAVAAEVGNLAQRSAVSARETTELIEQSATAVGVGSSHAETIAVTLRAVAAETVRAGELADELGLESAEQNAGIGQMGRTISQIEALRKQIAAGAWQGLDTSAALASHSEAVNQLARGLVTLAGGEGQPDSAGLTQLGLSLPELPETLTEG